MSPHQASKKNKHKDDKLLLTCLGSSMFH